MRGPLKKKQAKERSWRLQGGKEHSGQGQEEHRIHQSPRDKKDRVKVQWAGGAHRNKQIDLQEAQKCSYTMDAGLGQQEEGTVPETPSGCSSD